MRIKELQEPLGGFFKIEPLENNARDEIQIQWGQK